MRVEQKEIVELQNKVDQLYQMLEKIISEIHVLTAQKQENSPVYQQNIQSKLPLIPKTQTSPLSQPHKDILVETNSWQNQEIYKDELVLSTDVQIRRLTAQLTAAYNRIASLEEQLLACRIQS